MEFCGTLKLDKSLKLESIRALSQILHKLLAIELEALLWLDALM